MFLRCMIVVRILHCSQVSSIVLGLGARKPLQYCHHSASSPPTTSPTAGSSHSDLLSVPPLCQAHPQLKSSACDSQSHPLQTMAVSVLSFQSFLPFLSFSCQIALAGTSSTVLNTSLESKHPHSQSFHHVWSVL